MSDEHAESSESAGRGAAGDSDQGKRRGCQFPMGIDPETGEFVPHGIPVGAGERRGRGQGRPSEYCGGLVVGADGIARQHDRTTAFARRRELERRGPDAPTTPVESPARPVTSARATLAELLEQFQVLATAHQSQLTGLVDRIGKVVALAGDPDAAEVEVTATRRAADEQVRVATARAEEAEAETAAIRRELARALEDRAIAEGAAEDAIADRDEQVTAAQAEAEQARADAAAAREELERVRTTAAEQVATAKREALTLVEAAEQEARHRIELADRAASERAARAEHDAAVQITTANDERDRALEAQRRAESAQAAAEQAREDALIDSARLRADLSAAREQARTELDATRAQARDDVAQARAELAALQREARTDREQLRGDHAADLARVQAAADARVQTLERALSTAEATIARLQDRTEPQQEG